MSRRKVRQTAAFSLFTFLDVMLCTLGALIIVLICVVRTAQIKNSELTPQAAEEIEEMLSQRDTVKWGAGKLATSRDAARKILQDRRLELSHIEEHTRRMQNELAELEAAAKALARNGQHDQQLDRLKAEVERLTTLAAESEQELELKRAEVNLRRQSYAVVPYEGPSQTMRRPLYIECTANSVILQPENIRLSLQDFEGPLGPGNPLAAGLRAAREYLVLNRGSNAADDGEPYPLLLVRPDGITAFYMAREAVSSWGSEFGYEFIDQDWELEFREPQPAMIDSMRTAIAEARGRQHALARAMPHPGSGQRRKPEYFRAASHGGVVRDSGGGDEDDQRSEGGRGRYVRPTESGGYSYGGNGRGRGRFGGPNAGSGDGEGAADGRNYVGGSAGTGRGGAGRSSSKDGNQLQSNPYAAVAQNMNEPNGSGSGTGNGAGGNAAGGSSGTAGVGAAGAAGGGGSEPGGPLMSAAGKQEGIGGDGSALTGGTGQPGGLGSGPQGDNFLSPGGGRGGTGPRSFLTSGSGNGGDGMLAGNGGAGGTQASWQGNGPNGQAGAPGAQGNNPALNSLAQGDNVGGFSGGSNGAGGLTPLSGDAIQSGAGGDPSAGDSTAAGDGTGSSSNGGRGKNGSKKKSGKGLKGNGVGSDGTSDGDGQVAGDQAGGTGTQAGAQGAGQKGGQSNGQKGPGTLSQMAGGPNLGSGSGSQSAGASGQAGMLSAGSASSGGQPSATPNNVTFGAQDQQSNPPPSATSSMANRRGKNWGLPEESRRAVPIGRPVRVEVQADKMVLRSDKDPRVTQEIPLKGQTEDSVENLVAAVWGRVDTWGSAGKGMYWQPIISADVAPGAEGRYADLKTLLTDSGLEVRPAPKAPAQTAKPKRRFGLW